MVLSLLNPEPLRVSRVSYVVMYGHAAYCSKAPSTRELRTRQGRMYGRGVGRPTGLLPEICASPSNLFSKPRGQPRFFATLTCLCRHAGRVEIRVVSGAAIEAWLRSSSKYRTMFDSE